MTYSDEHVNLINKHVKLLLESGVLLEGIVVRWHKDQVELLSLDDSITLIVTHPDEDIRVIKIIHQELKKEPYVEICESQQKLEIKQSKLDQRFEKVKNQPSDDLRLKTIAELKHELIKQDKKIIAEKLKDHSLGEVKQVKYCLPNLQKIKNI